MKPGLDLVARSVDMEDRLCLSSCCTVEALLKVTSQEKEGKKMVT